MGGVADCLLSKWTFFEVRNSGMYSCDIYKSTYASFCLLYIKFKIIYL